VPHFLTLCILITQDHTHLSLGGEFWWRKTYLTHINKITLQVSSRDQDSNVVTTAYQLSPTTICAQPLHHRLHISNTSATSNHKKSAWLTQKLQGREPYLLNMPLNNCNVNMLIKSHIVKITFQSTLSKYFSLWLWLKEYFTDIWQK